VILAEYLTQIGDRIQDDAGSDILTHCLSQAIQEYSLARPQELVEDATGDGTAFLDTPTGWEAGFSRVLALQELDSSDKPTAITTYTLDRDPTQTRIYRTDGEFISGTTYRVRYTARHVVSAAASTLPPVDDFALCDLAASYAALRLSAAYAQEENANLGTVTIERKSKTSEYRTLARELRASFEKNMKATYSSSQGMRTWQPPQSQSTYRLR
jgi:hypothetical protein